MASAAGGSSTLDVGCVYRAVAARESAPHVRRLIEACASSAGRTRRSIVQGRLAAVNYKNGDNGETAVAERERFTGTTWREHERMVWLALDFQEVREIEARVQEQERRVQELEAELRARGGMSSSSSGSEGAEDGGESEKRGGGG